MSELIVEIRQVPITEDRDLTPLQVERLKEETLSALKLSYSPYSKFRVGCSILLEDGRFFKGANVENAAYGACTCAERTVINYAVAHGETEFAAIGISSDLDKEFISPCGICRQTIREFSADIPIYLFKASGDYLKTNIKDLLPIGFGPAHLS